MSHTWGAIVIGGGPAGAVAARSLARCGVETLLLDKATFPRRKVCGCCLNGAALGALKSVFLDTLPDECGAVPLERVTMAAGGRSATLNLPTGVALSREAFDVALLRAAEAAGVTVRPGVAAKLGPVVGDTRTVVAGDTTLSAKVVIVATGLAGGTESAVAANSRLGAGTVCEVAPDFYQRGTIHMATAAGGYVGLVRLEDDRLDVAAAFDAPFVKHSGGLGPAAERVLADAGFPPIPGLAGHVWKGTPPLTRTAVAVAGERWFAVGDAAGYVEPFTGEGMAWALASAVAVAPHAAAAWHPGRPADWAAVHASRVRSRQTACRAVARLLRSPVLSRLAVRVLAACPGLARPVVASINRPPPPTSAPA